MSENKNVKVKPIKLNQTTLKGKEFQQNGKSWCIPYRPIHL